MTNLDTETIAIVDSTAAILERLKPEIFTQLGKLAQNGTEPTSIEWLAQMQGAAERANNVAAELNLAVKTMVVLKCGETALSPVIDNLNENEGEASTEPAFLPEEQTDIGQIRSRRFLTGLYGKEKVNALTDDEVDLVISKIPDFLLLTKAKFDKRIARNLPTKIDIFKLWVSGKSPKDIAEECSISTGYVHALQKQIGNLTKSTISLDRLTQDDLETLTPAEEDTLSQEVTHSVNHKKVPEKKQIELTPVMRGVYQFLKSNPGCLFADIKKNVPELEEMDSTGFAKIRSNISDYFDQNGVKVSWKITGKTRGTRYALQVLSTENTQATSKASSERVFNRYHLFLMGLFGEEASRLTDDQAREVVKKFVETIESSVSNFCPEISSSPEVIAKVLHMWSNNDQLEAIAERAKVSYEVIQNFRIKAKQYIKEYIFLKDLIEQQTHVEDGSEEFGKEEIPATETTEDATKGFDIDSVSEAMVFEIIHYNTQQYGNVHISTICKNLCEERLCEEDFEKLWLKIKNLMYQKQVRSLGKGIFTTNVSVECDGPDGLSQYELDKALSSIRSSVKPGDKPKQRGRHVPSKYQRNRNRGQAVKKN